MEPYKEIKRKGSKGTNNVGKGIKEVFFVSGFEEDTEKGEGGGEEREGEEKRGGRKERGGEREREGWW